MTVQVLMPALSPTMTDGKLAKWHMKEGDAVESGDVLCEIETDKATMEVEAVDEGVLGKILVADGTEGVLVNAPIAIILEEGEDASAIDDAATVTLVAAPQPTSEPAAALAAPASAPSVPSQAAASGRSPAKGERVFTSPLARRIAEQSSIDISRVAGSGPNGRIVKRDVEAAVSGGLPALMPAEGSVTKALATEGMGGYTEVPNSTMRKIIAQRLQESKQTVPHFYLTVDCQIDSLLGMRKKLNAAAPEGDGAYKISVNDFVVRAVALALRQVPEANATWTEEAIRLYNDVDVSVAVATPNGLITPVVRNADQKGLATVSGEVKDLAARGRDGKLMPEEYQGGGFTISNLGMYGVKDFAAIINPPQSCILAVGAGEQRPVVTNGALAVATVMTCTLSVDHRSVDGAVGAQFLAAYKRIIEEPLTMML
ncbi:MAG: pyruvate dehydrogenase complex dihydrolipoamide acetyltransferase [Rhodospirillaceae bacterium]|jgi:pyruvate dehydrogenase E2 component (dihydrolipoamide acetyltransferase)|nr:pyruvate dehydrogenase complex dihydrolipoamide acetyltransferase [Rhodospirillaceae bacterium]MBT4220317.1 pyruvate dehydrogenase complex dihydrolipoamide acetyltransferase [Rhodospirillaceae bacterium]MBT4464809.1 pyruvate dehydrogenase complex dihydrolipoamide acetyltransferase [Rhodospirillaceae bacterium]MBT5307870.1 pyruvate dehydrogenase complex dihydrolipoamide acetyltransferase [Rhodospirillaceae bacterium]MBT6406559.1 pyruvate dehydrogenase complex dihydrolipoamide acetyltransferas